MCRNLEKWINYNFDLDNDPIYELIGNCLIKEAYSILQTHRNFDKEKFLLSLCPTLLFTCKEKDNNFYDFYITDEFNNQYIDIKKIAVNKDNPTGSLRETVDENGYAIISTVTPWLSFIAYYNPNFKYSGQNVGHAITILGYDDEYYYYHSEKSLQHPNNFIGYDRNNEIGLIKKEELEYAINTLLDIYVVSIGEDKTNFQFNFIEMIKNYPILYKQNEEKILDNEFIYTSGEKSLERLEILLCNIDFFEKSLEFEHDTLLGTLIFRLSTITKNRKLFLYILVNNTIFDNNKISNLVSCVKKLVTQWTNLLNTLIKIRMKKKDINILNYLHDIELQENSLSGLLYEMRNKI